MHQKYWLFREFMTVIAPGWQKPASGFKVALISGAGVSESHLGWSDMGVMSYKDNLETVRALASFSGLALIADGDTGYGNATTVHFTVRGFEAAGAAGVMLEDQIWPKRCGHMAGKQVVSEQEMVQKIKSACDARRDQDFVIRARTDAAGPLGVDAAIDRLNAYAEAGADTLYADALLSAEAIEKVAGGVSKTLTINMGLGIRSRPTTPLIHPKQLQAMGVAGVCYPRLLTTAAVRGMMNAVSVFQEMLAGDEVVDRPDLLVGFDEINDLTGFSQLGELDQLYAEETQAPE